MNNTSTTDFIVNNGKSSNANYANYTNSSGDNKKMFVNIPLLKLNVKSAHSINEQNVQVTKSEDEVYDEDTDSFLHDHVNDRM